MFKEALKRCLGICLGLELGTPLGALDWCGLEGALRLGDKGQTPSLDWEVKAKLQPNPLQSEEYLGKL